MTERQGTAIFYAIVVVVIFVVFVVVIIFVFFVVVVVVVDMVFRFLAAMHCVGEQMMRRSVRPTSKSFKENHTTLFHSGTSALVNFFPFSFLCVLVLPSLSLSLFYC